MSETCSTFGSLTESGVIVGARRLIASSRRNQIVSESPHLLVERNDHIVTLTFNRPESKNAFDLEVLVRL